LEPRHDSALCGSAEGCAKVGRCAKARPPLEIGEIEAALHGIADYTAQNRTDGRTMIGILITDGDPCGVAMSSDRIDVAFGCQTVAALPK
jgi:hypothetical protein